MSTQYDDADDGGPDFCTDYLNDREVYDTPLFVHREGPFIVRRYDLNRQPTTERPMQRTITVAQLKRELKDVPDHYSVRIWLPGSTISLGSAWALPAKAELHIEGNVDPGSALDVRQPEGPAVDDGGFGPRGSGGRRAAE